jgi:hypothetical protein
MDLEIWKGERAMKRKSLLGWIILVLLVTLTMAPGSAAARAVRVEFTGTEGPGNVVYGGIWTFLPSGNVHVRGMTTEYQELATDPRMSGLNTAVMNANWGPDFAGPMWGTNESVIPDGADCPGGGVWQGTWTGKAYADGSYSYRAVGRGIAGCVAGLKFSLAAANPGDGSETTYSGVILDPHGE